MRKLKVILTIFVVALVAITSASAQTIEDAAAKYTAAMEKFNTKDIAGAIPLMTQAMTMAIDLGDDGAELVRETQGLLPKMNLQMGIAAAQDKKYDEAVVAFLKAEELADLYGDANTRRSASRFISNVYLATGVDSFNTKDFAKALESFEKGYKQDPKNIQLASFTAKSYAELGQLDNAISIFKGVIEAGTENSKYADLAKDATKDVVIYTLVAMSEAGKTQDLAKTTALADTLATAVPNEPQSLLMVIQLANNLKKFDVVTERGNAAAEAQTDAVNKANAYFLVGVAYQNQDNKAKATEAYRKVTSGASVAAAKQAITDLSK